MELSIIIVNWNAKDYLKKCISSIYADVKDLSFEIIVVDNVSSDGSTEMIRSEFPKIVLIDNKNNLGYGSANNQAIKISNGKDILILNPDTLILPGCLQKLADSLAHNPAVGAVGPKILNPDGSIQFECARNIPTPLSEFFVLSTLSKRFPKSKIFGYYLISYWDHNDMRKVGLLSGSCMMIRKKVFDEIGMFDESFFMYAEEPDLFMRMKKAGWVAYFIPAAEIVHYWGKSAEQVPSAMAVEARKSMELFFKKYYGVTSAVFHRATVLLLTPIFSIAWMALFIVSAGNKKLKAKRIFLTNTAMFRWALVLK